jgi:uncharacterized protein YndB with AHSA1/START domain
MSGADEPVRIEVALPARFETVWQAFRVPEAIRRWHGWDYDGLEAEIHVIYEEETTASQPDRALEIGGHMFVLEDRTDDVVVRVTRTAAGVGMADYYDEIEQGWLAFLQQLRFALARHPGDDRRTVHLDGQPLVEDQPPVFKGLGLEAATEVEEGERYRTSTAWGDVLSGEVWFRSPDQLGLTVDEWGDGLLIVASPPSALAGASVTATTYGLDDDALEGLRDRMAGAWSALYGPVQRPEDGLIDL